MGVNLVGAKEETFVLRHLIEPERCYSIAYEVYRLVAPELERRRHRIGDAADTRTWNSVVLEVPNVFQEAVRWVFETRKTRVYYLFERKDGSRNLVLA